MSLKVLGLAGSLRRSSLNRRLLEAAALEVPSGARLHLWEGLGDVPPYNEDTDTDPPPPPVVALREAVEGADALLVATPEYNHSVPGQLKNALDWLSRPWQSPPLAHKPCAVVGASMSGYGAVWAQAETRKVLRAIGAHVIDEELGVAHAHEAFDADGRLRDPADRGRLATVLAELMAATAAQPAHDKEAVA